MRINIRGLGAVFPGGVGREALLEALRAGTSLVKASRLDGEILSAEIGETLKPLVPRKGLAALSRGSLLASAAIENLMTDEPWLVPAEVSQGCALVVGTAFGHVESKAEFNREARRDGVRLVSPILFPNTIINSLAGHAAILFGVRGPNSTVTSGRRSGLEALLRGASLLRAGRAARAMVVGCEEVSSTLLKALRSAGHAVFHSTVSPSAADPCPGEPQVSRGAAVCPGEASVALLLAAERSGDPGPGTALGVLLGAAERNAVGVDLREAVRSAMSGALAEAGLAARDVGWLALSTGGVEALDLAEASAARDLFGEDRPRSLLKGLFGETFGAAGTLSAAAALLAGRDGFVPPTPDAWLASLSSSVVPLLKGVSAGRTLRPPGPVLVSAVEETGATAAVFGPA